MLVKKGEIARLRTLLDDYEFSVNHLNEAGRSYLEIAIRASADTYQMCSQPKLHQGADGEALVRQLGEMVEFLLRRDCPCANIEQLPDELKLPPCVLERIAQRDDYSPFCQALIQNDPEAASKYADSVSNVNRVPLMFRKEGFTYLHLAVANARADKRAPTVSMVELLVRRGASARNADANGLTPLHTALYKKLSVDNRREVVRLLMAAGADPDAVCDYKKLLDKTREMLRKPSTPAPLPAAAAAEAGGGGSSGGLALLRRRLLRRNSKKTQTELRAEKSSEAQQLGTPLALARALGDETLVEMLTNVRYRRVTPQALADSVVAAIEFQTLIVALRANQTLVAGGHLDKLVERYRYAFYRFSPYLREALGGYFVVFLRRLQRDANVTDQDPIADLERKVEALVEQDLFYVKLLESRGQSLLALVTHAASPAGAAATPGASEFDEEFDAAIAMLAAIVVDDERACEPLVAWYEASGDDVAVRRRTRGSILAHTRALVQSLLVAERLAPPEAEARVDRDVAALGNDAAAVRAYLERLEPSARERYDARRLGRNANELYKLLKLLVMFQNAVVNRALDVDDIIATSAQSIYPDAVTAAVRHFIEHNQIDELDHALRRDDYLYGDLGVETIVEKTLKFDCVEYAAHVGAVRAFEWMLALRPQRVDEVGSCSKSLVAIAASADNPLVVVAIDYFTLNNPYWRENRPSLARHPNLIYYGQRSRSGLNVLQLCKQQSRPDLLEFCIGSLTAKVAELNPAVDFRATVTTFRSERERDDYARCIEILQREHDKLNGLGLIRRAAPGAMPELRSGVSPKSLPRTTSATRRVAPLAASALALPPPEALTLPPPLPQSGSE